MALRAIRVLDEAIIRPMTIAAGKTATNGIPVKHSGADNEIETCGAGDDGIGIPLTTGVAGDTVDVVMYSGGAIVPVKVGTGGATRGKWAVVAADGLTDKTPGGGTTVCYLHGKFLQSGVVGDLVGLLIANIPSVSA